MAENYLLGLGMNADEAMNYAIKRVNAAETWEALEVDWAIIKRIVTEERRLFQFRHKTRKKLTPGNTLRQNTLIHICTKIQLLQTEYQRRSTDSPMLFEELHRFLADWKALSVSDLNELQSFQEEWNLPDWEEVSFSDSELN